MAALPISASLSQDDKIAHVLDRLTFGARPGDIDAVRHLGLKKWINEQLHPQRITENPVLAEKLRPLDTLAMSPQELVKNYPPRLQAAKGLRDALSSDQMQTLRDGTAQERQEMFFSLPPEKRQALSRFIPGNSSAGRRERLKEVRPQAVIGQDLAESKIYRAVYSNRQLAEVLTDFWFNHFNVFLDKGADRYLTTSYERDAIRPHVLGKFKDMVLATAQSPAMLFYLDNWQSVGTEVNRRRPNPRARGLNENYARELMELHTLGVDGGYTQKDVTEVARCFTGWTIQAPRAGGGFEFNPRIHDDSEKIVLGHRIAAGGGKQDGLRVIEILVSHPSTARFISRKLAVRFVADNPPQSLVDKMAKTFSKTDGDLRAVMKTMLNSKEFWAASAYRAKMKSPLEMVASALRAMDANVESAAALVNEVSKLGQPLYRKQEPTGYSNSTEDWVNSAALVGRMNFAVALAENRIPGVKAQPERFQGLRVMSPETKAAIEKAEPVKAAGLMIGGPDFQRR